MTCPECGETHGPVGGRCAACGYELVFAPETDGTTDAEWLELVRGASRDGRRFFTENQLYLEYARGRIRVTREIAKRSGYGFLLVALGLGLWVYALKADWGLTLVLGVVVTMSGVALAGTGVVTQREPAAREPVARWLEKWLSRKTLPKLIRSPELEHAGLEYVPLRVERLLIVERDILVDLLLRNDAQRELSALIVSASGYPQALTSEAQRLLDERSDLPVFAIHDSTAEGIALHARLQKKSGLPLGDRQVLDAGLFPADVSQIEELSAAIPASHTSQVPLDFLAFETVLAGLLGLTRGAPLLSTGIAELARGNAQR